MYVQLSSILNISLSFSILLVSISDKNGVNDVYDYLKQNGGLSDKGDGLQLFKVTGNVDNSLIAGRGIIITPSTGNTFTVNTQLRYSEVV